MLEIREMLKCSKFGIFRHWSSRFEKMPPEHLTFLHVSVLSIFFKNFRNPEKGAFARGALRKFVANCAPNLRKSAGISLENVKF